jgi:hypothetical protein
VTTIQIFRNAKISKVDRAEGLITVTGTDTINGAVKTRAFRTFKPHILDRAEELEKRKIAELVVEVDSSTKDIGLVERGGATRS